MFIWPGAPGKDETVVLWSGKPGDRSLLSSIARPWRSAGFFQVGHGSGRSQPVCAELWWRQIPDTELDGRRGGECGPSIAHLG